MIYITGDTHGDYDYDKIALFAASPEAKKMTRDDYFIVTGDFGVCFYGEPNPGSKWYYKLAANGLLEEDQKMKEMWSNNPWTTLFIDGNHENHDELDSYPVREWHGGKVHYITDNIIHLMRGQVYDIDGLKFFTMGGAESTDKMYRTEGFTWWAREMPSKEEYEEAIANLEKVDFKVDYVITHCAPENYVAPFMTFVYDRSRNELTNFFTHLLVDFKLEFKEWYFGHYHWDETENHFHLIYKNIERIK